ncbi:MAG: zinc carboxypeptidase, partial [Planctomycetes bacterium]|nr:zinc carboxypeptidase [Planctomycetota bacterium]
LFPLLLALSQQIRPDSLDDVQGLVRVAAGALTLDTVNQLELDVASVLPSGEVELVADGRDRSALARAGIPYTLVHTDLAAFYASRLTPREAIRGTPPLGAWLVPQFGAGSMGGYYTYLEVASVLDQIHAAYPSLTTAKFSIGTTGQGRTLWAMKISDNPGVDESEPEVRFDAMHHAREPESMQSTFWLMLALLERYGTDALSTYLVNAREMWFVPCVNPDGYEHNRSTNPSGGGLWRKNRRANAGGTIGVDLNRNYDYQWGFDDSGSSPSGSNETYRGTAPASEPEIAAMQAFILSRSFAVAISAHTYSDLWLWPWGYVAAGPPNNAQYVELGDLCTLETNWTRGPAGLTLYLANGVTVDYDHALEGTLAFTPEIGNSSDGFWPPTGRIVPLAQITEPGFLRSAWAAGAYVHEQSRTISEVGDGDGFYEPGESFRLVFDLRNSGRATSGAVEVELESTTPGVTVTTGSVNLGALAPFSGATHAGQPLELALGAGMTTGTSVNYVARIVYEGFVQEFPGSFGLGQPRPFLTDDLELQLGWTVGAPGDAATTGVWAYGDPVGTLNGSAPSNPGDDATLAPGVRCFATGNGSTTAGGDDVDGGPTTLTSPRLQLSGVSGATLSYRRWFANATVLNDALEASLSDDDGASWVQLENVTGATSNSWIEKSFAVEDFVALTDQVRLRFRTGDQPNDSLTEAGVDEIAFETFDAGLKLNFYGRPTIGDDIVMHVAAPPGEPWRVLGYVALPGTPSGALGPRKVWRFRLPSGASPANGLARVTLTIPDEPALLGLTLQAQAFLNGTLQRSNVAEITFQ